MRRSPGILIAAFTPLVLGCSTFTDRARTVEEKVAPPVAKSLSTAMRGVLGDLYPALTWQPLPEVADTRGIEAAYTASNHPDDVCQEKIRHVEEHDHQMRASAAAIGKDRRSKVVPTRYDYIGDGTVLETPIGNDRLTFTHSNLTGKFCRVISGYGEKCTDYNALMSALYVNNPTPTQQYRVDQLRLTGAIQNARTCTPFMISGKQILTKTH